MGMHACFFLTFLAWMQGDVAFPDPGSGLDAPAASVATERVWPAPMAGTGVLTLIENGGQWPAHARFVGVQHGRVVRIERDGIAIELVETPASREGEFLRLRFQGVSEEARLEGLDPLPGIHSFFLGSDRARWQRGLRGHASVVWRELYPGIDLVLTDTDGSLACDLRVAPGADVGRVVMRLEGPGSLRIAEDGLLVAESSAGEFLHVAGLRWHAGSTREVKATAARGSTEPTEHQRRSAGAREEASGVGTGLLWSTYFGGLKDESGPPVTVDAAGDMYVCGATSSGLSFPMTPGAFQAPQGTKQNCFAAKLIGASGALAYSCVFGGSDLVFQLAGDVAVDSLGRATLAGVTQAPDFPTTPGAYDTVKNSPLNANAGFILRFTPSGDNLVFSTFIESPLSETQLSAIRVDLQDRSIIGGWAGSPDFPTTPGALQSLYAGSGDAIVARLSADGTTLEWSTFLGGTSADGVDRLILDPSGEVIVAGRSASSDFPTTPGVFMENKGPAFFPLFVARINDSGTALEWSTFLGGTDWQETDGVWSVNLGATGDVYVSGATDTETFPTTAGAYQTTFEPGALGTTFITRFTPDAKSLVYSTFYGGSWTGGVKPIVVDPSGVITGVGTAVSDRFVHTPGALDTTWNGDFDYHLVRFSPQGDRLFYAGFLGASGQDISQGIAMLPTGRLTVTGASWFPGGFPTTPGAFQESYNGGQNDGVITTLELYLLGVESFGHSKPSCLGPLTMNVTEMPAPGATRFAFWCSAAPPNAQGWLIVHLDNEAPAPTALAQASLRIPVQSDGAGYVETRFPLTDAEPGDRFRARYVFLSTPGCLPAGSLTWSNGLEITVTTPP